MAFRGTGHRMSKKWDGFTGSQLTLTADSTGLFTTSFAFSEARTILRVISNIIISPGTAPTVGDVCLIGLGLAVVSTDAFTVGSTAMPDPLGEPQFPWLWWKSYPMQFNNVSTDPSPAAASVRETVDARAMRKVKPREALCWIVEYFDIAGAPNIDVCVGTTRVLMAS